MQCCYINGESRCLDQATDCPSPSHVLAAGSPSTSSQKRSATRTTASGVSPSASRSETISTEHVTRTITVSGPNEPTQAAGVRIEASGGPVPFTDQSATLHTSTTSSRTASHTTSGSQIASSITSSSSTASRITTTSMVLQAQSEVTMAVATSTTSADPTCNENSSCVFPPSCSVQFPGYISCSGGGGYTRPPLGSSAATTVTSTSTVTDSVSDSLGQKQGSAQSATVTTSVTTLESGTFHSRSSSISPTMATTSSHQASESFHSSVVISSSHPSGTEFASTTYVTVAATETIFAVPVVSVFGRADANAHILATVSTAITPTGTSLATISEDGRCGYAVDQTCAGSSFGACCSKKGQVILSSTN